MKAQTGLVIAAFAAVFASVPVTGAPRPGQPLATPPDACPSIFGDFRIFDPIRAWWRTRFPSG